MSSIQRLSKLSQTIWDAKYRFRDGQAVIDATIEDTWRRTASALASVEVNHKDGWESRFLAVLQDFRFIPGGRVLAGAGTGKRVTLFNCFVMGVISDSLEGIFSALQEGAITMQQGGGVGYDFSTLRPLGTQAKGVGMTASGPISFMRIWDSACAAIVSSNARRGAMMATLRCDHPDIEKFIDAKREATALRHFNLSVQITDAFMDAVRDDGEWLLVFPVGDQNVTDGQVVERRWTGTSGPVPCRVVRCISARSLWSRMLRAAYDCAEPGVLFIDRINNWNNLWYCEQISATNPCGEVPLPPYGVCDLGSINLTQFISAPFSEHARVDFDALTSVAQVATRMLDNVYDISRFPIESQAAVARRTRRIGLGLTGLADALIMLGVRYGSDQSLKVSEAIMQTICHAAYGASVALAREKGVFPLFDSEKYLAGNFIRTLPDSIRDGIRRFGMRNSHLSAIAPAGTISLFANNVSSGVEPVFAPHYRRRIRQRDGTIEPMEVIDYAYSLFHGGNHGKTELPSGYSTVSEVAPESHLAMQAVLQRYVDNSISKTVNLPEAIDFESFSKLYERAYQHGLKGFTTFRPNAVTGEVLVLEPGMDKQNLRCTIGR